MADTFWLRTPLIRENACEAIMAAPDDHIARVYQAKRSDRQNRMLHAIIGDIREQVPDMAAFSLEDTKKRFMNALGMECRFLPCLETAGQFPVGLSTSELSKAQFAALQELVLAYGSSRGVRFSDPRDMY